MQHMMGNMFNQFSEFIQTHNECNFDEEKKIFKENPLGESCKEVIKKVSPTSLELICPISYHPLQLVHVLFTRSPLSISVQCSSVKPIGDYVITNPNDDLGHVKSEKEHLRGGSMSLIGPQVTMKVLIPLLTLTTSTQRICPRVFIY